MQKERGCEKVQPQKSWWHLSESTISLIISTITLIICVGECYVQQTQIDELLKSDKPKYHLSYELIDTDNDNYEDNEFLKIKSYGREASNIKIYTKTFIRLLIVVNPFRENVDKYRKTLYIPINGYFNDVLKILGYEDIITTDNIPLNLSKYYFFIENCWGNNTFKIRNFNNYRYIIHTNTYSYEIQANCSLIKFVIIDYEDTHENKHKLYYEGNTKVTEKYYNDIVNQSKAVFHDTVFKIDQLKLVDVVKYIENAHKDSISINNYSRVYRREQKDEGVVTIDIWASNELKQFFTRMP